MNLLLSISILYLNFQSQVTAKFYYELDSYKSNKFALYECEYEPDPKNAKYIDCKLVSWEDKKVVYSTATFYSTYLAEMEPGWYMYINGEGRSKLPFFGFLGLIPGAMDLPKFQNYWTDKTITDKEFKDKLEALSPTFIEAQYLKDVHAFLRLNNVKVIMNHEDNWRELISSYFLTLVKIMSMHEEHNLKRNASQKDKAAATKWMKDVKTVTKIFLNKMIDPCAILISGEVDKRRANLYCQTYCEFVAFVGRLFGLTKYLCDNCNYITGGKCVDHVCTCNQYIKIWKFERNQQVKMLYCHNKFRLMLDWKKTTY